MNEIKFKLSAHQIDSLKRYDEIMNKHSCQDILIKTNKDKNIIIVLCNLSFQPITWNDGVTIQDQDHSSVLTLEEKADEHFMLYAHKQLMRFKSIKSFSRMIMPVAVPPIENYECKIFKNIFGVYCLEMNAKYFSLI